MRRLCVVVTVVVLALASACGGGRAGTPASRSGVPVTPADQPGDHDRTVSVAGLRRSFVVHVPAGHQEGRQTPAVIVLHGGGGNGHQVAAQTGMSAQADRAGFLAVYPDGSGRPQRGLLTWNAGHCCGYALDQQVDDVAFVAALIDELERDFAADPARIFLTGMSNGAMMSYRAACELADRIAAIAPVAGSMGVDCRPSAPVSVVAFHGTADQHVRYDGGAPRVEVDPHPRQDPPVADTLAFWAGHDGCTDPVTEAVSADTTREARTCADGTGVTLYTIEGGGHAWPGGTAGRPAADRPTTTISATELMWQFFQEHPRPA